MHKEQSLPELAGLPLLRVVPERELVQGVRKEKEISHIYLLNIPLEDTAIFSLSSSKNL